jgi:cell division protein FtsW (lipid II flippase)
MSRAAWAGPLALLVPLGTGVAVMIAAGAPRGRWALHLTSGALGLIAYVAVRAACRSRDRAASGTGRIPVGAIVLSAAFAGLAATLAAAGLEGVHRWIRLGPVLLHPSALFCPLVLVLAWHRLASHPRSTLLLLLAIQAVHIAQPDAGQATAFGAAAAVLVLGRRALLGAATAALATALAAASVAIAWTRPDPLAPAPFVEDIVSRAFGLGALWGVLALASLILLGGAPLLGCAAGEGLSPALSARTALVVYLAGSLGVVLAGEFPVPLLGFGSSPVIGAFLGLALLASCGGAAPEGAMGVAEKQHRPAPP